MVETLLVQSPSPSNKPDSETLSVRLAMIDSLKLRIRHPHWVRAHKHVLTDTRDSIALETGERHIYGRLKNLRVWDRENETTIEGSLSSYFFDDSLEVLTRNSIKQAFEMLSGDLGLSLQDAIVTKLEFGPNLRLSNSTQVYVDRLGDLARYIRLPTPGGVLYKQGQGHLSMYNKAQEAKRKARKVPFRDTHPHILRLERAYVQKLAHQLKVNQVTPGWLCNAGYLTLTRSLRATYARISRLPEIVLDRANLKDRRDLSKLALAFAANDPAFYLPVNRLIKELSCAKMRKRMSGAIKDSMTCSKFEYDSSLIQELDEAVYSILDSAL